MNGWMGQSKKEFVEMDKRNSTGNRAKTQKALDSLPSCAWICGQVGQVKMCLWNWINGGSCCTGWVGHFSWYSQKNFRFAKRCKA